MIDGSLGDAGYVREMAQRASVHFTSDTITPRTKPLTDAELDALVDDDMQATYAETVELPDDTPAQPEKDGE